MSDAGSPSADADLVEHDKPAAPREIRPFLSERLCYRLRNASAAIASVAAVDAVIGGLTSHWNAWVIGSDTFKIKTPPSSAGSTIVKSPSVAVLPIENPTKATVLDPIANTMAPQLVSSFGKVSVLRAIIGVYAQ